MGSQNLGKLMKERSPAITMPFKLGNLIYDESVLPTCVDITGLELITSTTSLLSEPGIAKLPLVSFAHDNRSYNCKPPQNGVAVHHDKLKKDDDKLFVGATENGFALHDSNNWESREEGMLKSFSSNDLADDSSLKLAAKDPSSICSEQCTASDANSGKTTTSPVTAVDENIGDFQSIQKSYSWDPAIASEIVDDIISGTGNNVDALSERKLPPSILEVSQKVRINRQSVLGSDSIPLWGFTSIRGRSLEMEDAVVAMPRFLRIPSEMLMDIPSSTTVDHKLSADVFGVYDGHGGSQVIVLYFYY